MPEELGTFRIPQHDPPPSSPQTGQMYYDTGDASAYIYDANYGQWISMTSGKAVPLFRAYRTSNGSAIASVASAILYNVESYDPSASFDPTTGKFTAPKPGMYHFDAEIYGAGTYATTTDLNARLYKNGTLYSFGNTRRGSGIADNDNLIISDDIYLVSGDTVEVRVGISTGNFTAYGQAGGQLTRFSGHFVSTDYAGGVVTPKFRAYHTHNTGSYSTGLPTIVCSNENYDHGSGYNTGTGVFTAPMAGVYHFDFVFYSNTVATINKYLQAYLQSSGGRIAYGDLHFADGTNLPLSTVSADLYLQTGETVTPKIGHNNVANLVAYSSTTESTFFSGHMVPEPAGSISIGDKYTFITPVTKVNRATAVGWTTVSCSADVPGAATIGIFDVEVDGVTTGADGGYKQSYMEMRTPGTTGPHAHHEYLSFSSAAGDHGGGSRSGHFFVKFDSSKQFDYQVVFNHTSSLLAVARLVGYVT